MKTPRGPDEITLSGPPHNASALVPLEADERVVAITLQLPGGPNLYQARLKRFGAGNSEVRLRLPRETPPGTYSGEVSVGGELRRISVNVEPIANVRVQPQQSSATAEPGGKVEFSVDIVNRGNVPFDVAATATFDLTAETGQGGALGRALHATLGPDERRVDRFFEELRASNAGEARLTVTNGSGSLPPAQARALSCTLELPRDAQPGRYTATWPLGNTSHTVLVEVKPSLRKTRTPE